VRALQQRLSELGYVVAAVDGDFGLNTLHAVYAFQKVQGLGRDGLVGPGTMAALAHPRIPSPRSTSAGVHVEIDLTRQVMLLLQDGRVTDIVDVSTDSNQPYVYDGHTYLAVTPTGEFHVDRKIDGVRVSHLGQLYRPAYFNGGIAIHGEWWDVPPYPASHGCVRVTNVVMDLIYNRLAVGTPISVYAS
jgi:peptidoglycan hydrolase-like protein with peptidoglycan-binding domain